MHKIASCDVFVLLDDVQYTKNGWQNRNKIKGAQGPVLLTVPVRDPTFKPINAVEIDSQAPWREKHWKSIIFNYSRAPYFGRYCEEIEQALRAPWDRLSDLNIHLVRALCRQLGLRTELTVSSSLGVPGQGTEKVVGICRRVGATSYLTGAFAAGNHLDDHMFGDAGIDVVVQDWACPTYRQQFPAQGFIPELSIVDLIFNEGPESAHRLLGAASAVAARV